MATVNEYSLGTPCWFELGTTDQAAAKEFYSQNFGWHPEDIPMGPGEFYTMFQLEGRSAGAAYTLPRKLVAAGVGAHWNVYFATPDVDASTAKVAELGGAVVQPPFEVVDVGRMSNCKDPGGAMFSLWQARRHAGAGVINENNSVLWTELATRDTGQAREFYTGLFGWKTKGSAVMATYLEFSTDGRARGGLLPMGEEWGAQATRLGATLRFGPHSAPGVGRFASLADPQGAAFSVITPQPAG
jgi:predicted enzyme related to lactoylglutathione lyase